MAARDAPLPDAAGAGNAARRGLLYALGAFLLWGAGPVYFRQLTAVPALEIVAHRLIWAAAFAVLLVLVLRQGSALRSALAPRKLAVLTLTAVLIAAR